MLKMYDFFFKSEPTCAFIEKRLFTILDSSMHCNGPLFVIQNSNCTAKRGCEANLMGEFN